MGTTTKGRRGFAPPGARIYVCSVDATLDLLQRVSRSTVTVVAEIAPEHPSVAVLGSTRLGSGTLIGDEGIVLTVNYVVLGASSVGIVDVEGRHHDGAVVAQDFASGVAVVRIESCDLLSVAAGDSGSLEPGAEVFMVASLGGDERRTTTGLVTAVEPFDAYWEYRIDRAIWTTATNPGLGGGPLCNRRGEIVGVVSLNLGAIGRATLAIPAEYYFQYADELLAAGRRTSRPRRAWLGIFCHALPGRTVVAGVIPRSPGERDGLAAGDIILSIAGKPVAERSVFYDEVWSHQPGEVVELLVYREGKRVSVAVESCDVEDFFS